MRISSITILILFICFNLSGQDNNTSVILENYKNVNLEFFTTQNSKYEDHLIFKAFKARIVGDKKAYVNYLSQYLETVKNEDLIHEIGQLLYFAYLDQGQRKKAIALDKQMESLNFNVHAHILAKKADYPPLTLVSPVNETQVKFEQFYFEAVVGQSDTIKVFFDTGAPGVSVSQDLVEKNNWPSDTNYTQNTYLTAMNMTFKNHAVLVPSLRIGEFELQNIPAKYSVNDKEQQARLKKAGIKDHDILMGIDVFEDLLDGIEFDYKNNRLRFIKELPEINGRPNFMMADSKPTIEFQLDGERHTALLDTGSPRHVLPDPWITKDNSYFKKKASYGDFAYDIFYVKYDRLLNQKDIWLDTADYGGFPLSKNFNIESLFGSFLGRSLTFDFRNRQVSL